MKGPAPRTDREQEIHGQQAFHGFKLPTSSTTYTPNQFFDVVLPHASRGCLRLVAHLIRQTLGWSDEHGNPQNPTAHVSYRELVEHAGISRGAIKAAIQEALDKGFIDCLRVGQPHQAGEEGFSALYSLRWDERDEYITDLDEFNGFYAGNGNLTHIPNQFFDHLVPAEPLAVVRVVGVIIRNTIGFQTRFGLRRQHVEMSFSEIMRRTGIASSSTVSSALRSAVEGRYIRRVSEGVFDPAAGVMSKATTFGVLWDEPAEFEPKSGNGSKIEAGDRFKNRSGDQRTVQKSKREKGSKIEAANGSKIEAGTVQKSKRERFKNRSDIETTLLNNLSKQQQTPAAAGETSLALLVNRLMAAGLDEAKAAELASRFDRSRIERQLDALPSRRIKSSQTGFLIRAIELDIPVQAPTAQAGPGAVLAQHFYAELGGNPGEPMGCISPADEDAARSLLARLPAELQDRPQRAGRELAKCVLRHNFTIRSLPLAIRSHGDEFLSAMVQKAERDARDRQARLQAEHQRQFEAGWRSSLRAAASRFEAEGGPAWEQCAEWFKLRTERRRRISSSFYQKAMQQWEDPEARLDIIIEYLSEANPQAIPSFWEWDADHNPHPFSTEGAAL